MIKSILFSFAVVLLSILLSSPAAAQHRVSGVVLGKEDQKPLSSASTMLCRADSTVVTGTVTDNSGTFILNDVKAGNYLLVVSYVGFESAYLNIAVAAAKDMGKIELVTNTVELDGVVVTGNGIIHKINTIEAIPTAQQMKASTSGIDLLANLQLPGLFVDPILGTVQIAGTSGVAYRINGINATLQQVTALKADKIAKVEYSQVPTVRELSNDFGVINYILKEAQNGTDAFFNVMGAVTTGFVNANANLNSVYNKSQLSVGYNFNLRDYTKRWFRTLETFHLSPTETIIRDQLGREAPFGYVYQDINLEYIYNDSKNIFSIKSLNTIVSSHDRRYVDIYMDGSAKRDVFRDIRAKSNDFTPSIDMYYIRKFDDKQGMEVNLVGTLKNSKENRTLTDVYFDHSELIYNQTTGRKRSLIFETFYFNKKNRLNYNIGVQGTTSRTENDYNDLNITKIKWNDLYSYASIESSINNFSYSFGTGLKLLHTSDPNNSMTYYRNLSTLSLFYKAKKWNVRNITQYTPSYPSLSNLSDVDQRQDNLWVIRGNPHLKPSQTLYNRLTFTYVPKKDIRAVLYLFGSKVYDIRRDDYFYDPAVASFVSQTNNQIYESALGASSEVNISSIFKIFSIRAVGNWINYQSKGPDYFHKFDNFSWFLSVTAQKGDFSLMAYYKSVPKNLYGQSVIFNEAGSGATLKYQKNDLSVTVGILCPFTPGGLKYGSERLAKLVPSQSSSGIRDNGNMVMIGFSYYFARGKSTFKVDKRLQNSDTESGILKAN